MTTRNVIEDSDGGDQEEQRRDKHEELSLKDAWEAESVGLVRNKERSKMNKDNHFLQVAT